MLVIVSDLHLTDGSSGKSISTGAFRVFRQRLSDLAYDASWRKDGRYKPIAQCDVILLGDILDVIRSSTWLGDEAGEIRPWSDPTDDRFVQRLRSITQVILEKNAKSVAVLQGLSGPKGITIPQAKRGKPRKVEAHFDAEGRRSVKVNIHYVVGNHDWFYHLPGEPYNEIRQTVTTALGLANPHTSPFPHDPRESTMIMDSLGRHGVFARHGDIFDPFNYEGNRDQSSLGDAIVVELLNRFPTEAANTVPTLPMDAKLGLKELDNVRPLTMIPVWLDGLLRRTCADNKKAQKQVKRVWDGLVDDFLKCPFVKARDSKRNPFDNVDKLEMVLKFSKGLSLRSAARMIQLIKKLGLGRSEHWYEHALEEDAFVSRNANFIVYGHTHHHEIVPLDVSYSKRRELCQLYLNSGTWRRVHRLAQLNRKDEEFIDYNVMTYLAFFTGDERRGRSFEAWSGALAPPPDDDRNEAP